MLLVRSKAQAMTKSNPAKITLVMLPLPTVFKVLDGREVML